MSRPTTNRSRLNCESLEARENPAGNVSLVTDATVGLVLYGNAADNQVQVSRQGGDVVVTGLNGTLVQGQASVNLSRNPTYRNAMARGLRADLGAGTDTLVLRGISLPAVNVERVVTDSSSEPVAAPPPSKPGTTPRPTQPGTGGPSAPSRPAAPPPYQSPGSPPPARGGDELFIA